MRSTLTKPGDKVVEHAENGCLPAKRHVESTIDGNGRGDGENGEGKVVELLPPVVPGDGRPRLLVLEGPGDIVVGMSMSMGVSLSTTFALLSADVMGGVTGENSLVGVVREVTTEDMAVGGGRGGETGSHR